MLLLSHRLGELLEESQMEASRLRQKAEELVRDSELLPTPSPSLASFDHLAELTGTSGAWSPLPSLCASLFKPLAADSLLIQKSTSPSFILRPQTILAAMFWL